MLHREKVLLRPIRRSDASLMTKWFNDLDVLLGLGYYLPMTEMGREKFIEKTGNANVQTDAVFAIEAIDGAEPKTIGSLGIGPFNNKDHSAEYGIAIGEKDYWGKGYGTEALQLLVKYGFEQLNLHRIASHVFSFNDRSLKMHRKVGFVEEGREREASFINGEYCDHILFGLLRSEWRKRYSLSVHGEGQGEVNKTEEENVKGK